MRNVDEEASRCAVAGGALLPRPSWTNILKNNPLKVAHILMDFIILKEERTDFGVHYACSLLRLALVGSGRCLIALFRKWRLAM